MYYSFTVNTVPPASRMKVNNAYAFSEILKKGENLWIMNAGKKLIEVDVLSVTRWKGEGGGGEKEMEIKDQNCTEREKLCRQSPKQKPSLCFQRNSFDSVSKQ